jgi:hypothetical protein
VDVQYYAGYLAEIRDPIIESMLKFYCFTDIRFFGVDAASKTSATNAGIFSIVAA